MKTLIVPMHGSIGSVVEDFARKFDADRVLLVHPWKPEGAAHQNAEKFAEFLQSNMEKSLERNRGLGGRGRNPPLFQARALNCYEKAIDIAVAFERMVIEDMQELQKQADEESEERPIVVPSYEVIMIETTPIGYSFGLMSISGAGVDIGCHIGTIGFEIRKPRRTQFDPSLPNIRTFEKIPLMGDIQSVREWLSLPKRTGSRRIFELIISWYRENDTRWQNREIFTTIDINQFSKDLGSEEQQNTIANQLASFRELPERQHVFERVTHSEYRITPLGKLIARTILIPLWESGIEDFSTHFR